MILLPVKLSDSVGASITWVSVGGSEATNVNLHSDYTYLTSRHTTEVEGKLTTRTVILTFAY